MKVVDASGNEKVSTVISALAFGGTTLPLDTTAPAEGSTLQVNGGEIVGVPLNSFKNKIINGSMEIWQRGTSFAAIATGVYFADRWFYGNTSAAVHTVSRSTDVPTVTESGKLYNYSSLVDCTTADGSVAAGDLVFIGQRIEGYNWRMLAQKSFTISFWVKATKTGTYCVSIRNKSTADRSYIAEYTVNTTATWEKKTVNVTASPSAGTWDYTNGIGIAVCFTLMCGSTFQTTAGAWQTGNYLGTSNQVNACDDAANDFRITGVQVEAGDYATLLEDVNFGVELLRCMRYCQMWASPPLKGVVSATTAFGRIGMALPVPMRIAPSSTWSGTVNVYDGTATPAVTNLAATDYATTQMIEYDMVASGGGLTVGRAAIIYQNTTATLKLDAEL